MSPFDKQLPSDKDPPPKRRGTKDHLSVRIGSFSKRRPAVVSP